MADQEGVVPAPNPPVNQQQQQQQNQGQAGQQQQVVHFTGQDSSVGRAVDCHVTGPGFNTCS